MFKATLAELAEARISFTIIGHYLIFRKMKVDIGFGQAQPTHSNF